MANIKITRARFEKALIKSGGNFAVIAKRLGVCRQAVWGYVKKHKLQDLIDAEEDTRIDIAENKLDIKVAAGDMKAIKFFLSTKGKNRGYVTRQEVENNLSGSVGVKELSDKELKKVLGK